MPNSPVLHMLNAEYLVARRGNPAPPELQLAGEYGSMAVYRDPRALPRFFLVGATVRATGMADAIARLKAPGFDPRRVAVVEEDTPASAGGTGTVRVLQL